jgi:hypothetical protein
VLDHLVVAADHDLGVAAADVHVGVVALAVRYHDRDLEVAGTVLVVADEDRCAVPAPERVHAVEDAGRQVAVAHPVRLGGDEPVLEAPR